MCPGSAPNNCTPTGRSIGSKSRYSRVRSFRLKIPSEETNSVVSTSAPCSLQIWRNTLSETPAMGARNKGKRPSNQGRGDGGLECRRDGGEAAVSDGEREGAAASDVSRLVIR